MKRTIRVCVEKTYYVNVELDEEIVNPIIKKIYEKEDKSIYLQPDCEIFQSESLTKEELGLLNYADLAANNKVSGSEYIFSKLYEDKTNARITDEETKTLFIAVL